MAIQHKLEHQDIFSSQNASNLRTVPPYAQQLTIVELLNIALQNNPETRIAWWNAKRAAAALGSAKSAYYPQLSLDANITNAREFQFVNGPDAETTILSAGLVFSMMLMDSGERAADVEATSQALIAAGWENDWAIQKVMSQVFENAYLTIYAQNALEALLITYDDALKMNEAANMLNRAGLSSIADVYSSKASLAQIQIDVTEQKAQLEIQRAKLAAALGLQADILLQLAPINALTVPQENLQALIVLATSQRQDLLARRARLAESLARERQAVAKFLPKLSVSGVGGAQHAIHTKAEGGNYQISLNLSVPLFTGFDALYQKRMAYADVRISSENVLQLELDIALEVLSQSSMLKANREMLDYADENLLNAKAAYEGSLEKYNAGKEGIAEVSITLRQLATARLRYSDIHARYLVAIANLAFATGSLGMNVEEQEYGKGLCSN